MRGLADRAALGLHRLHDHSAPAMRLRRQGSRATAPLESHFFITALASSSSVNLPFTALWVVESHDVTNAKLHRVWRFFQLPLATELCK